MSPEERSRIARENLAKARATRAARLAQARGDEGSTERMEGPVHSAASAAQSQEQVFGAVQERLKQERAEQFVHGDRVDAETVRDKARELLSAPKAQDYAGSLAEEERPEIAMHRAAHALLAEEARARFEATRLRAHGEPPARPFRVHRRRTRRDPTAMFDASRIKRDEKTGQRFVTRWVRTTDSEGRPDPNLTRVQEFKDVYEYEIVTDASGQPVTGPLGVLMQGHPECYRDRVVDYAPAGAAKLRATNEEFRDLAGAAKSPVLGFGARPDTSAGHG